MIKPTLLWALMMLLSFQILANPSPSSFPKYQLQALATDLHFPWSLAFLPSGEWLVTERSGQLLKINQDKQVEAIQGLPKDIYVKGQGGLLDVSLHPNFSQNAWVYLSYASGSANSNGLKVIRAKLVGNSLTETQVLLRVMPNKDTPVHYAGRMTFLPDHSLLITSGDGFDYREDAQRLDSLLGKTIRIKDDGSAMPNNPFVSNDTKALRNYVFSYGHRNHQGIVFDAKRQVIFSHEHGPEGGDELNIIQAGVNYGWPVITHGRDYIGARISPFTHYPNMQQPLVDWTPSIAPSGMAVHQGQMFNELNGDLFVSVLKFKQVLWLKMNGLEVVEQIPLFTELGQRIRDVRVDGNGAIYFLTDSAQGALYRVIAKSD
ncbi:PQQ-dependent sugar dehydrogenase [Paraglaciecola aestuariivivens]